MLVPKQKGFQENKRFQTCHHLLLVLVCLLIIQKLDHSVAEIQVLCMAEFKDRREHIQPPLGEMLFFSLSLVKPRLGVHFHSALMNLAQDVRDYGIPPRGGRAP